MALTTMNGKVSGLAEELKRAVRVRRPQKKSPRKMFISLKVVQSPWNLLYSSFKN
jgi:hypothetical protein